MTIAPTYRARRERLARRFEVLYPLVLFASRGLLVPRGLLVSRVYVLKPWCFLH